MRLKKIEIGKITTPNNLFLAPLAGYTNAVFRNMCIRLGAGVTFTEMVSAKGLCFNSEGTKELLQTAEGNAVNACQLFGGEAEYIQRAACSEHLAPFELIDINMGCPVPKIFKNGEGSALMANIPLAQSIVRAAKTSGKSVSVKFRTGLDGEHIITRDFAMAMEDAGADMITVHGRTRDKMYSGEVDYKEIAAAKAAVKIPVIANGGVFCKADADKLMDETGADGVMVARGAMYNPFVFAEITGTPIADKKAVVKNQLDETFKAYGERFATVYMRKMIAFYIKGQPNAAAVRVKLMAADNKREIEKILDSLSF